MRQSDSNTLGYLTGNIPSYMFERMKKTNLAERLKLAMEARNMSQASLAEAAGISQPSVWKITSGRTQSSKKLVEIANALQVRPEWLLNGSGDMDNKSSNSNGEYHWDKVERTQQVFDERGYGLVSIFDADLKT